jgi:hypothetical protein
VTNQVRCPHCGKMQLPTIRVQTVEAPADVAGAKDDPRKTRRVLLALLLSLTIVGLPIAYWLCQRFEKQYPVRSEPILRYSYCCSLCSYAWTWRTDEPLPRRAAGTLADKRQSGSTSSHHEGIANFSASHDFSTR